MKPLTVLPLTIMAPKKATDRLQKPPAVSQTQAPPVSAPSAASV